MSQPPNSAPNPPINPPINPPNTTAVAQSTTGKALQASSGPQTTSNANNTTKTPTKHPLQASGNATTPITSTTSTSNKPSTLSTPSSPPTPSTVTFASNKDKSSNSPPSSHSNSNASSKIEATGSDAAGASGGNGSGSGNVPGTGNASESGSGTGQSSGSGGTTSRRLVARDKTFKIMKKGMMNVNKINKFRWFKNMVAFTTWITNSQVFRTTILVTLAINLILIAVMSNPTLIPRYGATWELVDLSFLVIYTAELVLKVLSGPKKFWKVSYNRFDLFILAISYLQVANLGAYGVSGSRYFLRVFRALRALRALRFISFVRDLQVLFSALLKTFRALAYVLTLLLVILFVGACIAFQIYSTTQPDNPANPYSELLFGMLTLFCFVTADGWSNIQDDMDVVLGQSSRVLTVIILFLGHFMYENLLAGLMIQYMTEADEEEKKFRKQRKLEAINKKKSFIQQQQQQDLASFHEKQKQMMIDQPELSFHDILTKLAGKQNHNNIVPSLDLCCSLTWLELYTATLHHQEHSEDNMYRMQQLHFEVTKTLAEALERKLHAKIHV